MINSLPNPIIEYIDAHFNETLTIDHFTPLGGGCINYAGSLETNQGKFFIKWNHIGPDDLFIREAESLNEMRKVSNDYLQFPKPYLAKSIDNHPGFLLTDLLETGHLDREDELLGWGLASLHKINAVEFGFQHNNYCGSTLQNNTKQSDWFTFFSENRIRHLIDMIVKSRPWDHNDSLITEKFLYKIENLLSHTPVPSLIHGDLWSGNYLYTIKGPALIDPASCYCDREFELGMMTLFGGFTNGVFDAYNDLYPLPEGWKERNKIYQLYHVLNHYYLFGGFYKNDALSIMKYYL